MTTHRAATVDGLALVGPSRFGTGRDLHELTAIYRPLKITTAYCVPALPPSGEIDQTNLDLIALVQSHNDRQDDVTFEVLSRIDPYAPEAIERTRRCLGDGAVGIFLHPWEQTVRVTDQRIVDPIFALADESGVPVVIEAGYPWVSEPAQIGVIARRYPQVSIVATRGNQMNMSGLAAEEAAAVLATNPNLHYLTGGVYRQDWLTTVARDHPERVLFGSLAPIFDAELELMRIAELNIDDGIRRNIASANALRVYGAGSR